jgi:hypothetical protein
MRVSSAQDEEGCWRVLGPVWDTVSIYDGPDVFIEQFGRLSREQGHLLAAHWCYSEVCNGGFYQFFTNPTGVLAPEAALGFRAMGLPACAAVIEQAIGFFGAPYPREQARRSAVLERRPGATREEWDPFYQLDEQFYSRCEIEAGGFAMAADQYANQCG